jgi:predicted branched-subunit amino acid permease
MLYSGTVERYQAFLISSIWLNITYLVVFAMFGYVAGRHHHFEYFLFAVAAAVWTSWLVGASVGASELASGTSLAYTQAKGVLLAVNILCLFLVPVQVCIRASRGNRIVSKA